MHFSECSTVAANCSSETQIETRDGTVEHFPGQRGGGGPPPPLGGTGCRGHIRRRSGARTRPRISDGGRWNSWHSRPEKREEQKEWWNEKNFFGHIRHVFKDFKIPIPSRLKTFYNYMQLDLRTFNFSMHRGAKNYSCIFETSRLSAARQLGQTMHS